MMTMLIMLYIVDIKLDDEGDVGNDDDEESVEAGWLNTQAFVDDRW